MLIAHEWLRDGVASDAEYEEEMAARLQAIAAQNSARDVPNLDTNPGANEAVNRAIDSENVSYVLELELTEE